MNNRTQLIINKLSFAGVPSENLADYAYAIVCYGDAPECDTLIYKRKIAELLIALNYRIKKEGATPALVHALAICGVYNTTIIVDQWDGQSDEYHTLQCALCQFKQTGEIGLKRKISNWLKTSNHERLIYFEVAWLFNSITGNLRAMRQIAKEFGHYINSIDLSSQTAQQLVRLHALGGAWLEYRKGNEMESLTRNYFWRIAKVMPNVTLAQIFLHTEYLEAINISGIVNLPYHLGGMPEFDIPQTPAALATHIRTLSDRKSYIAREQLTYIADYIQTHIVEAHRTSEYLDAVNAILNTHIPHLEYPAIARELEKTTADLAKTNKKSLIELAPVYKTLWLITLKSSYLNRFQTIIRRCYHTLAADKLYPELGLNPTDPNSLTTAIQLLDANRPALRTLSEKYDVDKIIGRYTQSLSIFS